MKEKSKRGGFTGSLGFVLAAAGSAVGLGNIWRFPYLAAKDGGGIFLVIYIVLALTFGFTLLTTEIAIGRKTGQSPLTAYGHLSEKWKPLGVIASIVPVIIMPYYCVIGGWVLKYFVTYLTMQGKNATEADYFTGFIGGNIAPVVFMIIFMAATFFIVYNGVDKGIEKCSRILMPILFVIILIVVAFSLTLSSTDENGVTRTGLQGLKAYVIPDFANLTLKSFVSTVIDAMGQLFYSLSVAMGIMITYGSYVKKETDLNKSINQIEIFDTIVAFFAGMMIIPAVFAFSGGNPETLQAGPSLMFITLPKVFASMGFGTATGIVFFILVLLAALTSAVSLMETSVSTFMDELHWSRKKCCGLMVVIMIVLGTASSMGYGLLDFIRIFGMNFLDFFDFMTNSVMMPLAALATCILILRVVGIDGMEKEIEQSSPFRRKKLYRVFIKYFATICLIIILLSSIANVLGIISM